MGQSRGRVRLQEQAVTGPGRDPSQLVPATNSAHLIPFFHLTTLMALCNMLSSSLLPRKGTSLRRRWGIRSPNIEYSSEYVQDAELVLRFVLRFQRSGED